MGEAKPEIWEVWNFYELASRLKGTQLALRELKRRGDAGAIAAWAIYREYMTNLIRFCFDMTEPAYRSPMLNDMAAVGEMELIDEIEALHKKYPEGAPSYVILDLADSWAEKLDRRVGVRVPRSPGELTAEQIAESKRIARELWEGEAPPRESQESPKSEGHLPKDMKKDLREKFDRLRKSKG